MEEGGREGLAMTPAPKGGGLQLIYIIAVRGRHALLVSFLSFYFFFASIFVDFSFCLHTFYPSTIIYGRKGRKRGGRDGRRDGGRTISLQSAARQLPKPKRREKRREGGREGRRATLLHRLVVVIMVPQGYLQAQKGKQTNCRPQK